MQSLVKNYCKTGILLQCIYYISKPLQNSQLSANNVMFVYTFSNWVAIRRLIYIIVLHTVNLHSFQTEMRVR